MNGVTLSDCLWFIGGVAMLYVVYCWLVDHEWYTLASAVAWLGSFGLLGGGLALILGLVS